MKTNNEYKMKGALMGASVLLAPLSVLAHESHEHSGKGSNALVTALTDDSAFFRIDPSLTLRLTHGSTTFSEGFEVGGHDPSDDGFNFQGFEVSASIYAGDHIAGFVNTNIFKLDGEEFESEFEEGFLKLQNLPGNFELRGGRMLVRFGDQNAKHQHAFDFVNSNIGNLRFLGEEGLAIEGGEISWLLPTAVDDILSVSLGSAVPHEEEEGEESEADEFGESALPIDDIVTARYQARFGLNDFHRFQVGGSFVTGENGFGRTTKIYGADVTYTWRQNGLESGGQQLRWRNEWIMRDVEDGEGGFSGNSFNTNLLWEFAESWEAGLRYDYVEGLAQAELAERFRISTSLAKRFDLGDDFVGLVRLQYDHDDLRGDGTEDSVWLQFGFDWGGSEVR